MAHRAGRAALPEPGGTPVWWGETPVPLKEEIERQTGGIEALSRFYRRELSVQAGTRVQSFELAFVDVAFPAMLGLAPQAGDLAQALARPDALALTADMAQRLFGGQDVVGRTVSIALRPYRVAAVLPDRPRNSAFRFDALASTTSSAWDTRELAFREWGHHGGQLYLELAHGADLAAMGGACSRSSTPPPGAPSSSRPAASTAMPPKSA
ncbi:ABC transporter permease [Chitinimonas koreensis]|nr:ABC transporter permease [Chitinimonas koreensis]